MADATYSAGRDRLITGDWTTDTIQVLLITGTYSYSAAHTTITDITGEASGTGYSRKAVPTRTVAAGKLDHGDITWTGLNVGELKAAVYFDTADNRLLFFKDSGFPLTTNGSDVVLATGAGGLAQLT
jgi:hypothetical protein